MLFLLAFRLEASISRDFTLRKFSVPTNTKFTIKTEHMLCIQIE